MRQAGQNKVSFLHFGVQSRIPEAVVVTVVYSDRYSEFFGVIKYALYHDRRLLYGFLTMSP